MNAEMRENIKIALLGVIAVTLLADVFLLRENSREDISTPLQSNVAVTPPVSVTQTSSSPVIQQSTFSDNHAGTQPVQDNTPKTTIQFEESQYDFGDIYQETTNEHIFKFKNTGKNPLIIQSANGSCGCTVPEYPKDPIPPGGTGEIKVVYSPGQQENKQTKTVTVVANTEPSTTVLTITANVKKKNK